MNDRTSTVLVALALLGAGLTACTRRSRESPPAQELRLKPAAPARDAGAPGPGARPSPAPVVLSVVPPDAAVPPTEEVYPDRVIQVKGHTCQVFRKWIVRLTPTAMSGTHLEVRPAGPDPEAQCRSWRGASRWMIPSPHAWSSPDDAHHFSGEVKLLGELRDRLALELVDSCSSAIVLFDLRTGRQEKVADLLPPSELVYEGDGYLTFWREAMTAAEWERALPRSDRHEPEPLPRYGEETPPTPAPGTGLWTQLAILKGRFPAVYRGLSPALCPEVYSPPASKDDECSADWWAQFRLDLRTGLVHRVSALRCVCYGGHAC